MNFLNNVLMMIFGLVGRFIKFVLYIGSKIVEMIAGAGAEAGKKAKDNISNRFQQAMENAEEDSNEPMHR